MNSPANNAPRVLFYGTPHIAVPTLRALAAHYNVVAVVCQPDAIVGRDRTPSAPATKVAAQELGIPVLQPAKVRTPEFIEWVRSQNADVAVVIAYGRILIQEVLDAPRMGCVNLHASLLPRYRGAAPINWVLVNGEQETGISVMKMDAGVDTGPVYSEHHLAIERNENAGELTERLGQQAATVIIEQLPKILDGSLQPTPQDHTAHTLAPILKKEDGNIDWSKSALEVHNHIRGMTPWPGGNTKSKGKGFKILETRVESNDFQGDPGVVVEASKHAILVACGKGLLRIVRGQQEGRKPLEAKELFAGRVVQEGDRFAQ